MSGLGPHLSQLFSASYLEEVARQSGFMKRSRKLQPGQFLDSLMFNVYDNKSVSLNDQSVDLQMRYGQFIRKQSLDERFNEGSVSFVRHLLGEQLSRQLAAVLPMNCLDHFSSVNIRDSTRFQLPACVQHAYPGSGGAASTAGMHIQFEFDVKSGKIGLIKATDAKRQDATDALETVSAIAERSLNIRDLGYLSVNVLLNIAAERQAYYLTRVAPGLKLLKRQGLHLIPVDLSKEKQAMIRARASCRELEVYLDKDHSRPLRLLIELMPDQVTEQRLRKAAADAHKKKRSPLTKEYKVYASLGLYLTNVPAAWIKPNEISLLYRVRWQIELRFKCWKGLCRIHAFKKMKLHRIETCLYARLLYILIHWEISMQLVHYHWRRHKKMISVYKCFKSLLQYTGQLRTALFKTHSSLNQYLYTLSHIAVQNLLLEKRKGRFCIFEFLLPGSPL